MKVEIHINGALQVILTPDTAVEKLVLEQMQESSGKGGAVKLASWVADKSSVVVSVEA